MLGAEWSPVFLQRCCHPPAEDLSSVWFSAAASPRGAETSNCSLLAASAFSCSGSLRGVFLSFLFSSVTLRFSFSSALPQTRAEPVSPSQSVSWQSLCVLQCSDAELCVWIWLILSECLIYDAWVLNYKVRVTEPPSSSDRKTSVRKSLKQINIRSWCYLGGRGGHLSRMLLAPPPPESWGGGYQIVERTTVPSFEKCIFDKKQFLSVNTFEERCRRLHKPKQTFLCNFLSFYLAVCNFLVWLFSAYSQLLATVGGLILSNFILIDVILSLPDLTAIANFFFWVGRSKLGSTCSPHMRA